jgi:hypothetical protein
MKKILSIVLLMATVTAFGQHDHGSHQNPAQPAKKDSLDKSAVNESSQQQFSRLLNAYYNIKNALVAGDAGSASANASEFVKTINAIDYKLISEGNSHILATDAGRVAAATDLKKQREAFAVLSENMISVARNFKLSDKPVHVQYCPMKKASWLSAETDIRNPYYGSNMLTCGEVKETL